MPLLHSPNQNRLLAALPTADFERLAPHLELVPMLLGETLYEPGSELQHAYFPTTAIVSLLYVLESGSAAEIAGVGNEGLLGISLFMGGDHTPSSAVVQTAGHGYRLPKRLLKEEFSRPGLLRLLLLATAAGHADTRPRSQPNLLDRTATGRWLLMTLDRPPRQLVLMQEPMSARSACAGKASPLSPGCSARDSSATAGTSVLDRADLGGAWGSRVVVLARSPAVRRALPAGDRCGRRLTGCYAFLLSNTSSSPPITVAPTPT
jgi:hypothetical protein